MLQDVRSAFADFKKDKIRLFSADGLLLDDILEKNILYFISIYRKSEVDFLNALSKLLEAR